MDSYTYVVIVIVHLVLVSAQEWRGLTLYCTYEQYSIIHAVCVFCYDLRIRELKVQQYVQFRLLMVDLSTKLPTMYL